MASKALQHAGGRTTLSTVRAYVVAAVLSSCAVWITAKLLPRSAHDLVFMLPISVVAVCVSFGVGPAVLATIIGSFGTTNVAFDPVGSWRIQQKGDMTRTAVFLFCCGMMILSARFIHRWKSAR